mmetsp:Transcript_143305/g.458246  ORF Transcript_143305/g.458246 Transcript_143305/m.458246 type:complete len:1497 (+) Transcript_143305:60-4550(+)
MAMPEVDVAEAPRKTGVSLEGSPRIQCGFCGNLYVKDAAYCRKCGGKRDGMDSSADMEYDSMCGLELTHASGVYPLPIRDACISLGDDALAFAVGRHIAVWDHVKKRLKFIGRKQENCVITAMAKSASGRLLAVAERQGSSNDSRETGNVQISIVGLPAAWARAEDGSMVQQKEGVLKVLYPSNKRSKINALGFSADGRRLVSVSDMPDTSITYWKWETEKAIATHNVQLPITRLHVNPKNGQQISLSGCNYCRIWEFNPNDHHLRENASVFSLKEEKMTDVVDHNWVVVKEEAFLIVATREGHVHVFQDGERTEDIDVQGVIAKDESTGPKAAAREQAKVMAKMMGGVGPTAAKEPPPVSLMSLAVWGQGFVVGGDQGYLGVFKVGGLGQVEPFGTFRMPGEESFLWSMSAGSEDTYLNILSYTERDAERDPTKTAGVPKMVRSATSGFGGGRASRQGSMMPSEEQEPDDDKERVWSFSTFPVSQADLASTGQLDVFVPMVPMGLHHGSVNALATCHSRRIVATCGNDYMLKLWSFPEDGALDAPNAFGCEFSVQVSTYEKPTSLAVHPLGFQVAVVLQDMLRIYHVTAQQSSRTMFDLPLKHPGDVSYSHSGELLAVSQNNDVILIDPIKGVLVRIFSGSGGHLSFVNQVGFSADDKMLLSCSAAPSGAIYGWDLESEAKDRIFEHVSKGTDYAAFAHDFRRNLCCAIARPQGSLRMIGHLNNTVEEILPEGPNATYTAISLGAPIGHLFAGTQQGHVRIFEWPLKPGGAQANPFIQVELHAHSITSLSLCSNGRFLYSSCKGGAVLASRVKAFTFASGEKEELTPALLDQRFTRYRRREDGEKKQKSKREDDRKAHDLQKKLYEALSSSASNTASLDDLVMLPKSYFQELLTEIKHLEERHLSLKHESEHALEQKDVELSDKLEQMQHERKNETEQHDEKYDSLFDQHKKALKRSEDEMRKANGEFAKRSRNTEDDHDGKMSKEFEKQSLLLGELQTLRDHDQQKLLLVEEKHSQQLEDLRSAHENAMREWKTEYEKVCNLLKSDGLKFEEAMRQQEVEYEDQITDMLEVKRAVLQVESEKSTTAFKDAVSMKQTISMLQGNIVEYTAKFEQSERQKSDLRQQLEASREMFANVQEQLKEEKRALKVKNENLGKLREQMKHLESFRFVLFHKVKMMEEERDPLAEQVSSLKHNVREMYSEFVREFRNKQTLDQELTDKKVLTSSLQQENILVTRHLIQLKKDGRRLLNDVEAILHAETAAEFEKMPKRLMAMLEKYKSLSQWKAPVDDHAIEPDDLTKEQLMMNEMVIQRDLLFRKNEISKSASTQIKRECGVDLRRLSSENAALIAEMNTLRSENRSLVRSCKDQEAAIIAMRAKEKAKRMIDSVGEGGFLAHSESAPALDGGGGAGGRGEGGGGMRLAPRLLATEGRLEDLTSAAQVLRSAADAQLGRLWEHLAGVGAACEALRQDLADKADAHHTHDKLVSISGLVTFAV